MAELAKALKERKTDTACQDKKVAEYRALSEAQSGLSRKELDAYYAQVDAWAGQASGDCANSGCRQKVAAWAEATKLQASGSSEMTLMNLKALQVLVEQTNKGVAIKQIALPAVFAVIDLMPGGKGASTVGKEVLEQAGEKVAKVAEVGAKGGVTAVDAAVATGSPITTRFVNGVTVVDQRTGAIFNGTVDLQPTFDRIAAGATGLSRNDGTVFRNFPDRTTGQILLPAKPPGYYKEYVVPTPGINGAGPQRIVTGQNGEMFYTPDHYLTFIPVKKP